ncbi:complement C1q tumor necrosis factor-related protein 6-like [Hoplias malabaricus]|uniref:complement C1q tumor necrosis factor-related protein 6-like n=1 Tax=Hoplias malabaricus TaxID=27720 RepID=UPI003463596F
MSGASKTSTKPSEGSSEQSGVFGWIFRRNPFSSSAQVKLLVFLLVLGTNAQDPDPESLENLQELSKIRTLEEKMKIMEKEMKEMKKVNTEQAEILADLSEKMTEITEDHKVAFSTFLLDSSQGHANFGPFQTLTTVVYKHVFTNIGEAYNKSTGVFTAPLKGAYVFRVSSKAEGKSGNPLTLGLFKNDHHIMSTYAEQPSGMYSSSNSVTLSLEKGDRISVRLYPLAWMFDNGAHHHSSFNGHLLFPL